ncbi:LacI family DNA-binding transcriptional regulator [candidate division KSB1 bacterium]|nr:LacI family DNA-binding transcriptional regulator [candidate division KSB1 bacterium]
MKRITINDVAKQAGVSKGTVSAVINRKNTVKNETRNAVLAVMKELNFRPKGMARNLKQMDIDKSIGLIVKDLSYPFYTAVAMGVKEYANQKGYLVFITSSENLHEREVKFSQLFSSKDIKGAIIAPILEGTAEIEHLFKLKMINYPFILLEDVKGIQANVVSIDNIKAMKLAVKYLIDSGHSHIVHFAGPESSSHAQERIEGFRSAFSECHLIFKQEMIVPIGSYHEIAYQKTIEYFKKHKREEYPTAIVCFNDQQALAVMDALNELKLRVPNDISIVGNDDIYFARMFPVPLTTIQAPMKELGMRAAEILIRNIESPVQLPIENVVLEANFIVRQSTNILNNTDV